MTRTDDSIGLLDTMASDRGIGAEELVTLRGRVEIEVTREDGTV